MMKIKKADKCSSAGTEDDSSTTVDVSSISQPIAKPNVGCCTYLHKDDPMNLFEYMSNGSVSRWIKAIRILTGKSLYDMTIEEWVKFRKEQWFKCPKIGQRSIDEFDKALQTVGLSI